MVAVTAALALVAAGGAPASAASAADSRILYTSFRDGVWAIYSLNPDNSVVRLTTTAQPAFEGQPSSSPDGRRIAYVCGNFELCVMNADGSGQTRLTTADWPATWEYVSAPSWSPDGTRIAFSDNRTGSYRIYVINADGTGLTALAGAAGNDDDPSWSPDGKKIAFDSDAAGNNDIYVMNADGSGAVRLTTDKTDETVPEWSPDGTTISYQRWDGQQSALWVMSANGRLQEPLTFSDWDQYDSVWSPDGDAIAYEQNHNGRLDVFAATSSGNGATNLTKSDRVGIDVFPAWEPSPAAGPAPPAGAPPSTPGEDARLVGTFVRWDLQVAIVDYSLPLEGLAVARRSEKIFIAHDNQALAAIAAYHPVTDRGTRLQAVARTAFKADRAASQFYLLEIQALLQHKTKLAKAYERKGNAQGDKSYKAFHSAEAIAKAPY